VTYRPEYREAARRLGLSRSEYASVLQRIRRGTLSYGELPEQLGAMSYAVRGRVFVLRNVEIPARTYGWQIQLVEPYEVVDVYIPNRCGNISVVRTPISGTVREIAAHNPPPVQPLQPREAEISYQAPPVVDYVAPPVHIASPVHHHHSWVPLLLIPAIAMLGFHGGSHTTPPLFPPPGCQTPVAR
jgi:hypothetical protein